MSRPDSNFHNLGSTLRSIREKLNLSLSQVSALSEVDIGLLSKMERGERNFTKSILVTLSKIYNHDLEKLLILFFSSKIIAEVGEEELALQAMKVAEEQIKYQKTKGKTQK